MPNMGIKSKSAQTSKTSSRKVSSPRPAARAAPQAREAAAVYVSAPLVSASGIADALFTNTQQRVLGLLFGQPERSFFANEVITLAGSGSGAVQRELARLESSGLVTVQRIGNQKHFQANRASPIFEPLWKIIQTTVGLAGPLQSALAVHASEIHAAFVYGSVAKNQDTAASDVDLMVISDSLSYGDLFAALEVATGVLGRAVNPTVLSRKDVAKRIAAKESFLTRVLAQPKVWLIGSENDLGV
jgi:predicted nucleotidyltransferase